MTLEDQNVSMPPRLDQTQRRTRVARTARVASPQRVMTRRLPRPPAPAAPSHPLRRQPPLQGLGALRRRLAPPTPGRWCLPPLPGRARPPPQPQLRSAGRPSASRGLQRGRPSGKRWAQDLRRYKTRRDRHQKLAEQRIQRRRQLEPMCKRPRPAHGRPSRPGPRKRSRRGQRLRCPDWRTPTFSARAFGPAVDALHGRSGTPQCRQRSSHRRRRPRPRSLARPSARPLVPRRRPRAHTHIRRSVTGPRPVEWQVVRTEGSARGQTSRTRQTRRTSILL
mmetsp:Transcript_27963/g.58019  ORF Transcript_27963/g.58019 Transcript_27963/m.58019 type:complete len:279 (+) Transcript_27963:109-945(+)